VVEEVSIKKKGGEREKGFKKIKNKMKKMK
jgi:hypothetical protein